MELAGFNVEKQHSRQITLARPHSSAADATCVHGLLIVNKNRFVANVPETPVLNIPKISCVSQLHVELHMFSISWVRLII
jgi:hypothetical protein